MQWPPAPPAMPVAATPMDTAAEHQIASQTAKAPGPVTYDAYAQDVAMDDHAPLTSLLPMDRDELYDLAEMLLSEMIPGWDEAGDDEDDLDWEEEDEDEDEVEEVLPRGADPIVDASYRACILEAERYLVQCEGLDADGAVIADLKQYLHEARLHAATAHAQERQRAPGQP